jgi:hypothetical protein
MTKMEKSIVEGWRNVDECLLWCSEDSVIPSTRGGCQGTKGLRRYRGLARAGIGLSLEIGEAMRRCVGSLN